MKITTIAIIFIFTLLGIATTWRILSKPTSLNPPVVATSSIAATPAPLIKSATDDSAAWIDEKTRNILPQASNLNPTVFKLGLTAYLQARKQGIDDKQMLTIVDYSKPSNERRLWVVDLKNEKVLFNTWVAHGKNSGAATTTSFSNQPSSLKTSLGVFATGDTYDGHNGLSLHIQGLEHGFNDNAYRRDIVIHGAWYASADVAKERGMLGRSWGCPAVDQHIAKPLINTIKNNTLLIAYYPDKMWLKKSAYLNTRAV